MVSNFITTSWLWIEFCLFEIWACNRGHYVVDGLSKLLKPQQRNITIPMNKSWSSKLDLWFNYTRGLKNTMIFTNAKHSYLWKVFCWIWQKKLTIKRHKFSSLLFFSIHFPKISEVSKWRNLSQGMVPWNQGSTLIRMKVN